MKLEKRNKPKRTNNIYNIFINIYIFIYLLHTLRSTYIANIMEKNWLNYIFSKDKLKYCKIPHKMSLVRNNNIRKLLI